jgi:hypothetical protein
MTALQLGNCHLVRLRGTSDGGMTARLLWPGRAERCASFAWPNLAFDCVCEAL